jgi:hypothetical protein
MPTSIGPLSRPASLRGFRPDRNDLTTDEGVGFRIYDLDQRARLNVQTGHLKGSNGWTRIDKEFLVPQDGRLLQVQVVRAQSGSLDNKIRGTVWIDSVRLFGSTQ